MKLKLYEHSLNAVRQCSFPSKSAFVDETEWGGSFSAPFFPASPLCLRPADAPYADFVGKCMARCILRAVLQQKQQGQLRAREDVAESSVMQQGQLRAREDVAESSVCG